MAAYSHLSAEKCPFCTLSVLEDRGQRLEVKRITQNLSKRGYVTGRMTFTDSKEMKITLAPDQEEMLSTKETIKTIIKDNPDTVMAYDIFDEQELIGFVLVNRFEEQKYFLWEYAIDIRHQNKHKGTKALIEFINYMKVHYDIKVLTTTYIYGNSHAKHIYEKIGFVETDVVDELGCHEVNMVYYCKNKL